MNKAMVGWLTKEPEKRTTPNGVSVTTFSVAVNRRMNRKEETDFFNIVAWREGISRHMRGVSPKRAASSFRGNSKSLRSERRHTEDNRVQRMMYFLGDWTANGV